MHACSLFSSSLWNIQDLCPILHLLASFFEFGIFSQMWMNVPWGLMTAIQMPYVKIPRSCTSACAKWVTLAKGRNVKVKRWNCSALPCLSNCTSLPSCKVLECSLELIELAREVQVHSSKFLLSVKQMSAGILGLKSRIKMFWRSHVLLCMR